MINPVLKIEIKRRVQPQKLLAAIFVQIAVIGAIFPLVLRAKLGRGLTSIMISEAFWAMLISPILCSRIPISKDLLLTPLRSRAILFGKVFGSLLYPILFILTSLVATIIYALLRNPIWIIKLVQVHIQLIAIVILFGCLTNFFSQLLGRSYPFSAHISYLIMALLVSSVYLSEFIIDRFDEPSRFISVLLHLNPIIAIASTLGYDILRSRYIYELSPIPMYRFIYPSWHLTFLLYMALAICLFGIALWWFKKSMKIKM